MQAVYFVDKQRVDCTFIERSVPSLPSPREYVPSSMPGESQEEVPPARRPLRRATSRAPSVTPAPPNVRQDSVIESQTPAPEGIIPARKVLTNILAQCPMTEKCCSLLDVVSRLLSSLSWVWVMPRCRKLLNHRRFERGLLFLILFRCVYINAGPFPASFTSDIGRSRDTSAQPQAQASHCNTAERRTRQRPL